MLTLHQLQTFVRIADAGSLSRVAAAQGLSQPALSRLVRSMEKAAGAPLLYRHGRGVTLTDAGRRLQVHAAAILNHLEALESELEELGQGLTGSATVAIPPGAGRIVMVPLVMRFNKLHPRATIRVQELFTGDIMGLLASGDIEVGALYSGAGTPGIVGESLVGEGLYLVGLPGSPGTRKPEVALETVAQLPLMMPTRAEGVRGMLDRALSEAGLRADVRVEVDSTAALLDLVRGGLGYVVFPYCTVYAEAGRGEFAVSRVIRPTIERELVVATSTKQPLSPTAREAARMLRESILEHAGDARWVRPAAP